MNRIMLIDDDKELLLVLEEIFSNSFECKGFLNAHDALIEIKSNTDYYDCILCDLMMPKMNGREFYQAVRTIEPSLLAKIIFLTGGSYSREMDQFLKIPEINYCEKPIQVKEIQRLIEDVIQKKKTSD